jgi:hypothetical protein
VFVSPPVPAGGAADRLLAQALGAAPAAVVTPLPPAASPDDGLRGKARQHALVLGAFRRAGGELHAQAFAGLAAELGWQRQSVSKRCSELKRDGLLEQPAPGVWRLTERGRGA